MSIEAMKQALEALEFEDMACRYEKESTPEHIANAITSLRQAIEQAEKQEPKCVVIVEVFGKDWRLEYMSLPVGRHKLYAQQYLYTTPQPQEEHHAKDCALLQIPSRDCDCSQNQEPVALVANGVLVKSEFSENYTGYLYTAPQQRQWVGLTDEEVKALVSWWPSYDQMPALMVLVKDIQNSIKEKNT